MDDTRLNFDQTAHLGSVRSYVSSQDVPPCSGPKGNYICEAGSVPGNAEDLAALPNIKSLFAAGRRTPAHNSHPPKIDSFHPMATPPPVAVMIRSIPKAATIP
jgi:hypothetical protein